MKAVKDPKMYCFILLVLISGDVAKNPGPVKHPRGKCERPVQSNQRGIQCEDCMFWHHIKCIEMTVGEYNNLSISTDSWFCKNCILPNFTDSYFETNNKTTSDCESSTPEFDYVPLTPNTSAVNFEIDVNNDIFAELKEVRKCLPNQF